MIFSLSPSPNLFSLVVSPANCAHLASQFGWQQWLLSLFAAQGYESSVGVGVENTTVLSELTKGIFVVVLYHQLLYEPHGWRSIEWTQTHALLFAERVGVSVFASQFLLSRFY